MTCFDHPPLELIVELDRERYQHLRKMRRMGYSREQVPDPEKGLP
jgi:hypothetical protein